MWRLLWLPITFGALAVSSTYVKLNVSPSVAYGFYRVHSVTTPVTVGTLVIVRMPVGLSVPLLKPVAAVAGEWVCREGEMLVIHGENYGRIYEASDDRWLPSLCFQIPSDHVFLASHTPKSLDSRYYGPVAIDQITATATPLWTWKGSAL